MRDHRMPSVRRALLPEPHTAALTPSCDGPKGRRMAVAACMPITTSTAAMRVYARARSHPKARRRNVTAGSQSGPRGKPLHVTDTVARLVATAVVVSATAVLLGLAGRFAGWWLDDP